MRPKLNFHVIWTPMQKRNEAFDIWVSGEIPRQRQFDSGVEKGKISQFNNYLKPIPFCISVQWNVRYQSCREIGHSPTKNEPNETVLPFMEYTECVRKLGIRRSLIFFMIMLNHWKIYFALDQNDRYKILQKPDNGAVVACTRINSDQIASDGITARFPSYLEN